MIAGEKRSFDSEMPEQKLQFQNRAFRRLRSEFAGFNFGKQRAARTVGRSRIDPQPADADEGRGDIVEQIGGGEGMLPPQGRSAQTEEGPYTESSIRPSLGQPAASLIILALCPLRW
jgi:hypothetical protein